MFKSKKLISMLLAVAMVCSANICGVVAESVDYSMLPDAKISELSGIPLDELDTLKKLPNFEELINDYIPMCMDVKTNYKKVDQNTSAARMPSSAWNTIKGKIYKGNILISRDQSSAWGLFNHGHAAIAYDRDTTVEALGTKSGPSNSYNSNWWADLVQVRLYMENVTSGDTVQNAAGNFAYNSLKNIPYETLASCSNTKTLNCATLVWHAYNSTGVVLDKYLGYTCIPKTLVEDKKLSLKEQYNWAGGEHTW